jgi:alpha-tubulin suppressor-like RCC1 family protein
MAGGAYHSLAVTSDGRAWAWGYDGGSGVLGNGKANTYESAVPVQVINLTGAIAVAGGEMHSVALRSDGTVWAWGGNGYGQLGNGGTTHSLVPVQVSNLTGATAVAAGDYYSLALRSDGTGWSWGAGALGNGTTTNSSVPVQVNNLTSVSAVDAGHGEHSLAVRSDGTIWAWGGNFSGELGDDEQLGAGSGGNLALHHHRRPDVGPWREHGLSVPGMGHLPRLVGQYRWLQRGQP